VPTTADPLRAFEIGEAALAPAHHELLPVEVVRPAEEHHRLAVRRDLEPVHREVEVTSLDAQDQAGEGVLAGHDRPADLLLDLADDVDFEADVAAGVLRVFVDDVDVRLRHSIFGDAEIVLLDHPKRSGELHRRS